MRIIRKISQVIGLAGASVLMPSIVRAAGASVPDRIDGFPIPKIVSDSVMVEIAGYIDRFGVIATTTGFILALFAPILVLALLVGLRDIGEQTSNRAVHTRPYNVLKFERRVRSPNRTPSRTNEFRIIHLKAVTVILIAGLFAISSSAVQADTKKVQVPANKSELIDAIAAYDGDSCRSLLLNSKIGTPTKNGRLMIKLVKYKMPEGVCRGQTVQILAVGYQPKRGFRGKDEGSIKYSMPPRRYSERQIAVPQTRKYIINVK